MTTLVKATSLVLLGVALLIWLLIRSFAPQDPALVDMRRALDVLALNDSRLHADVLSARAGLLQNYDPLVLDLDNMRAAADALSAINAAADRAIADLKATVDEQERLVETFKSSNALLQNSLSYFDLLSERVTAADADAGLKANVGSLMGAIAHLSQDASPETTQLVQTRIDALQANQIDPRDAADVASLLLRGRLLLRLLPRIDETLRALRDTNTEAGRQALRAAIHIREVADETRAARFRVALFGAALCLGGLVIVAALRSRKHAVAMRRRAHLEHLIGLASNQFIACVPEEIPQRIDDVLRAFGEGTDPDRVYVLLLDKPSPHLWLNQRVEPRVGWPDTLQNHLRDLEALSGAVFRTPDDLAIIPKRLRDALTAAGVVSWSCVKLMRGDRMVGVLCFERAQQRPSWLRGTAGLLRMQGDVIGNALHREFMFRERQALEARLRQGQRLEALGTFTSGVAHNFNNVIGTVLGHAEMAADAVSPDSVAARHVAEIAAAGERAREIVSQILDFGRPGRASHGVSSPDKILAETIRQLRPVMPHSDIIVEGCADEALVTTEPAQLQQVLVNLVRNAEQASVPGASITVGLARVHVDVPRTLSHGVLQPGRFIRVTVSDRGRGMGSTTLSRLFEPFFTTKSAGTGLGLATALEIVSNSGGAFDVRSLPGQGSTFEVWLPEATSGLGSDAITATGGGGTVLLVGAEPEDISGNEELLAALGYEPVGYSDPKAAIAAFRRQPKRFDVAIADRHLAGMSGLDFAKAAHAIQPLLPILLCLSATDWVPAEDLSGSGVTDVLRRPWRSATVAAMLDRSIRIAASEWSSNTGVAS